MKLCTNTARCAALAAGALIAACSGTGNSSLAPSPHQTFGSGSDSAKILIANTTSGIIETIPIPRACWRVSPSLPSSVAPGTTSQPVTLYAGSLNVGCNPPLSLDFRYYGLLAGKASATSLYDSRILEHHTLISVLSQSEPPSARRHPAAAARSSNTHQSRKRTGESRFLLICTSEVPIRKT
jgi:hypothetical protein